MTDRRVVYQAAALVDAGSPAEAMRVLAPYLATEPDDPYALCIGAQSLLNLDEAWRSMELSQRAAGLNPDDDWPIRLQALAMRSLDRFADAQAMARRAVLVGPANWQTHYLVALTDLWADAVTRQSLAAAERARELAPDEADTHRLLGTVALRLGKAKIATDSLEQALRLDPEDAVARHELARAHLRRLRIDKSLRGFLAVGQMDPTISQTRINLNRIMVRGVVVLHYTILLAYFTSAVLPFETTFGVTAIAVGVGLWARRRGGPALFRFIRTLWTTDRLLVVWAGLLVVAAVLVVIRPVVSIGESGTGNSAPHQGLLTLALLLILGGVAVSWLRRSRNRAA